MESAGLLYGQSTFLVALVFFVLLMAASEGGYLLGRRWRNASDGGKKDHVSVIQGAVFAMLGLLLAFSFSMAAARFENRKQNVVEESNAIGTSYLRTDLLPEPQRTASATLFREYTDARLGLARPDWYLSTSSRERERVAGLQRELWAQGVAAAELDQRPEVTSLFVSSLNEVFDAQARRDAGLRNHVPEIILVMIFAFSILTLGILGYGSGLAGGRSILATAITALLIVVVVFVIMDLDRPYRGLITVNQQAMIDVRAGMDTAGP